MSAAAAAAAATTIAAPRRCRLVRMRRSGGKIVQDSDVYIGRDQYQGGWSLAKSKWANPFKGPDRAKIVRQYEEHLLASPELMPALSELKGKSLGCWCAPDACHGDVLVKLVNKLEDQDSGVAAAVVAEPAAAASSSSCSSSAAAAAASSSIFSAVRSPVTRHKRAASPPAVEDDEEQKSQEDEDEEAAEAVAEEAVAEAQPGPKGRAARATKKQKLDESKPTIPDEPSSSADEPAAAASSASSSSAAAAASSSSVAAVPGRSSPSVLSFPAATLSKSVPSYGAAFDTIAQDFLLNYELIANGVALRLLEIEFYYRSADSAQHVDLFAHAHPVQFNNFGNCQTNNDNDT